MNQVFIVEVNKDRLCHVWCISCSRMKIVSHVLKLRNWQNESW